MIVLEQPSRLLDLNIIKTQNDGFLIWILVLNRELNSIAKVDLSNYVIL